MNFDKRINQLKQAFLVDGIIVKINTEEWYSMDLKKNCKTFIVRFDTEEKMRQRVILRDRISSEKKLLKKYKKNTKEYNRLKNTLEWLNDELKGNYASKDEFYSKLNVLLFLVEEWKLHKSKMELVSDENK
ncbi:MAG: hypothetical protein RSB50_06960 [Cetobacterium sp.]